MLETIDDDLDEKGLALVKISDAATRDAFGLDEDGDEDDDGVDDEVLVYFENGIPFLYEGETNQIMSAPP